MVSAARCGSTRSGRLDLDLMISGPRVTLFSSPYSRARSQAFFGLVLLIPWRVGAEQAGAAKDGFGGAMRLDPLGPPGLRSNDFRAPRYPLFLTLLAREVAGVFRAGSLDPLARGCRTSWRGEGWFRRRDAAR